MDNTQPRLTVVIPSYNYAATLRRAVMSVVPQLEDGKHELMVIDDGSRDETPSLIEKLKYEVPNQVRFLRKQNGGPSSVRNMGICEAANPYLVFLDADDELHPRALHELERHIEANPETRMVIGGHISVEPDGSRRTHKPRVIPEDKIARVRAYLIDKKINLCNGACAMHKELFARGYYPESYRSAEDLPVFAQALAYYACSVLDFPLALIYKHDDSLRHQFDRAKAGGLRLVEEVFSIQRLGPEFQVLKPLYFAQRSLSLFRSAYLARDHSAAKEYFEVAVRANWRVLLNLSYSRKALRLWLR